MLTGEHAHDPTPPRPLRALLLLLPLHRQLPRPRREGLLRLRHAARPRRVQVRPRGGDAQGGAVPDGVRRPGARADGGDGVRVHRAVGPPCHQLPPPAARQGDGRGHGDLPVDGRRRLQHPLPRLPQHALRHRVHGHLTEAFPRTPSEQKNKCSVASYSPPFFFPLFFWLLDRLTLDAKFFHFFLRFFDNFNLEFRICCKQFI